MGIGGRLGRALERIAEQVPVAAHGLLLNLGGPDPLDEGFLGEIAAFLDRHDVPVYGDHLTFCGDGGLLYELLPMPFSEEAVHHMAGRIRRTQAILGRRIAVENASYYVAPETELGELEFINAVLAEADCDLLLDVNNVYVNSVNHGYDPEAFLRGLPGERIAYAHVAGHLRVREELAVDTHGASVVDPVWALLETAYAHFGVFPTMLERDENIPDLDEVLREVDHIIELQCRWEARHGEPAAAVS